MTAPPWPKQCACCNRSFTQEQWNAQPLRGYVGTVKEGNELVTTELRDCVKPCTNTMGVEYRLQKDADGIFTRRTA